MRRTKEGALTERVAMLLLGASTGIDPEKGTARFGQIVVNLATGRFYDQEEEVGGTHLELIRHIKPDIVNGHAEEWLEQNITKFKPTVPPELEKERTFLGLLAMNSALAASIEEDVGPENFSTPIHQRMFEVIAAADAKVVQMSALIDACGGDPLMPVIGAEGFTVATYIAKMIAEAPSPPDAAHFARTLAGQIRSASNRDAEVDDGYNVEEPPPPFVSQFNGIPFEDLDEPGLEHEHIIDGIITVGDKSVIGGASRSGKSFFAIDMAMCIALKQPFFGHKMMKPGLVIYQAGEGGRGIKKRFRAWRQYHGIPKGLPVPLFILQSKVDIYSPDGDTNRLIEEVRGISRLYGMPVVALFIDTLAKASGMADENSGRDMGVVMNNVDLIADAIPGSHVCLVHHMNAGGNKLRGHTSVYAGVDQVILISRDEENPRLRKAVLDKQKDEEDGAEINFELIQVTIGRRPIDQAPITSCVPLPVGAAISINAKGPNSDRSNRLTDDQAIVYQALVDALNDVGIPPPPVLRLPRSIVKVCKVHDWINQYRSVSSKEEPAIRQAMSRASDRLVRMKLIGRLNPYVWLTTRGVTMNFMPSESSGDVAPDQAELPALDNDPTENS